MKGSFETTESLQGYLHEPDTITGHLSLPTGGSGGTSDYKQLYNKPKINGVTLDGDISSDDLGIDSDGIYVGSGEMPEGYNVQIDPAGEASGIDTWEEVAYVEIEEDAVNFITVEFEVPYKDIYVFISQRYCETKLTGSRYIYPKLSPDIEKNIALGVLRMYVRDVSETSPEVSIRCTNHNNKWIERTHTIGNGQGGVTPRNDAMNVYDTRMSDALVGANDLNFYRLVCDMVNKGTRILVLGVRA